MFHKIRQAMAARDEYYTLEGTVIVDDAFFGSVVEDKKRGHGTEKANVLVAISLTEDQEHPLFAKMKVIENMKDETVSKAISDMIDLGSTIRSDAHKTIANLKGYAHEIVIASKDKEKAKEILHWVNVIISNAKSYILGTYHGLPKTHLQKYLDEFCYRLNRRFCEPAIFDKLINACLFVHPITRAESSL